MHYNTLYVRMDVHKKTFTLCYYDMEEDKVFYPLKVEADYMQVLKYLNAVRSAIGNDVEFLCGYETECLVYHTYSPVHIPTKQDEQVKE